MGKKPDEIGTECCYKQIKVYNKRYDIDMRRINLLIQRQILLYQLLYQSLQLQLQINPNIT